MKTKRTDFLTLLFGGVFLATTNLARAGDGSIDTAAKTLDISVLFSYQETDDNLDGTGTPTWKAVFNDASSRLWNATNGQLQIGKVTVYRRAFNKKDSADVWILKGGGGAYANGVNKLGVAGNRMTFYQNTHRSTNAAYQGGFSLVHEMGHYVFGCYDEYLGASVPVAKKTTFTDADLSAYTKNSPFVYSISSNDVVASIMDGGGGVKNTRTEFDTAGNRVAGVQDGTKWWMNKQWIKNKESCWETMGKFKWGGVNVFPTVPAAASDTALPAGATDVTWEVIPTLSRLVLCIDRSGSMSLENRMELAKLGARILTSLTEEKHEFDLFPGTASAEHVVFDGDFLGVVDFDDAVTMDFPMTEIDKDGTARANAKAAIDLLSPRNSTAIGDGAQQSLDLITALGTKVTQEAIILLSDGQDNASTISPATAAANAKTRGAKIYTIALGSGADGSTLAAMAATTGGKFYAANNGLALIDIYTRIYGELKGGSLADAISDLSFENTSTDQVVNVDAFTEEVTFAVSSPDSGFALAVTSPKGVTYTGSVPADAVVYGNDGSQVHFRVSHPAIGKWKAKITSPNTNSNSTYQYSFITSSSNSNVSVTAYSDQTTYTYPAPALLRCQVTAGDPVAGATVTAEVSGPDGVIGATTLFDDGIAIHGDEAAGDGVYSGYYSAFPASGTYTFTVRVVNTKGVTGIANPEKNELPIPVKSIAAFSRETTTNLNVTGVPFVNRAWARVNALSLVKSKTTPSLGAFKTWITFNAPGGSFKPAVDDLSLYLNSFGAYANISAKFFKEKKPGTFSINDPVSKITGSLVTNIGGSSRCELHLSVPKMAANGFPYATPTSVNIQFGTFFESVSIKNSADQDHTAISYNAKKDFLNSSILYVDGFMGSVNHAQLHKDSFRAVTTLEGLLNYDPEVNSLIINLGGLVITVPAKSLTFDAKGLKGKGVFAFGDGSVTVALDLGSGVLSIKGSKLNVGTNLGGSMIVSVKIGTFDQNNLLTLSEKVTKGTSVFKF